MQETFTPRVVTRAPSDRKRPALLNRKTVWSVLFVITLLWAFAQAGIFKGELINPGGWPLAARFFEALLHPELSGEFLLLTLDAALTTLAYAVSAIFLSIVLGFIIGILASEVWWLSHYHGKVKENSLVSYRTPWTIVRAPLAFFRSIHEPGKIICNLF